MLAGHAPKKFLAYAVDSAGYKNTASGWSIPGKSCNYVPVRAHVCLRARVRVPV